MFYASELWTMSAIKWFYILVIPHVMQMKNIIL